MSVSQKIIKSLKVKTALKQKVFDITAENFAVLKEILQEMETGLKEKLKETHPEIVIRYKDRGDFEAELEIAEDTIIFLMHSNVFTFSRDHSIRKSSYVQDNESNAFCGMICVLNFLTDSFRYNRLNDIGYQIARIFINKDRHYFVEGKRQMGFLYNDFDRNKISRRKLKEVVESIVSYSLDFDMFAPPFEENAQLSLNELIETQAQSAMVTGKRLGFKFNEETNLNADAMKK